MTNSGGPLPRALTRRLLAALLIPALVLVAVMAQLHHHVLAPQVSERLVPRASAQAAPSVSDCLACKLSHQLLSQPADLSSSRETLLPGAEVCGTRAVIPRDSFFTSGAPRAPPSLAVT